jgi:hypothetical protein
MSLSVCLLTRNEENNIRRALVSVKGIADEVIVADTGSSDRTADVAAELGARVCQVGWEDDFAAARNQALDQATGDWILWLNPDEEFLPAGRERLTTALNQKDAFAYGIRVQDLLAADRPDRVAETYQPRLFRREAAVRYVGRLHPHFATSLEDIAARHSQMVYSLDITVRRHAYLSVLTPDKLRWAARLLELELGDRPGQLHYLIEYGRTLLHLNDARGHEVLAEAVELILPHLKAARPPSATVGSLVEYLLNVSPEQSRSKLSRAEALELALRWFRRSPPVMWAVAQQHFRSAEYRSASTILEELIHMGRTGAFDHSAGFDPDVMGTPAVMNLGVCYLQLGELDKAQRCFGQLLTHPTLQIKARENFAAVEAKRAKLAEK